MHLCLGLGMGLGLGLGLGMGMGMGLRRCPEGGWGPGTLSLCPGARGRARGRGMGRGCFLPCLSWWPT